MLLGAGLCIVSFSRTASQAMGIAMSVGRCAADASYRHCCHVVRAGKTAFTRHADRPAVVLSVKNRLPCIFSSQAKKVWTGQFEFVMLRLLCGDRFVKKISLSRQTLKQNQKKRIVKERCINQL